MINVYGTLLGSDTLLVNVEFVVALKSLLLKKTEIIKMELEKLFLESLPKYKLEF